MTPVQASTIPLFMQHKDVVVEVRLAPFSFITASEKLTPLLAGRHRFRQDPRVRHPRAGEAPEAGQASRKEGDWRYHHLSYPVRHFLNPYKLFSDP